MKTDDWQKIKEIFNQAIELPETDRATLLAKYEADLREVVEKLLKAHEEANDFIVEPALVEIGLVEGSSVLLVQPAKPMVK